MGAEDHDARGRRDAGAGGGAGGGLFRQGLRHDLPRPPAQRLRPRTAREVDRFSLAAMFILAGPVPAGRHPAGPGHRRAVAGRRRDPRRPHADRRPTMPWLSIVPIAESRSSYNGLLVFVFIAVSAVARGLRHPPLRLARAPARAGLGLRLSRCRARRRNIPPASFAQPIRRVFGTIAVPRPRTCRACRRPAIPAPPRLQRRTARSRSGTGSMQPIAAAVGISPTGSTGCSS